MPEQTVTYRGERFTIGARRELAIDGDIPWCIKVDGAWYQIGTDAADAADDARRFLLYSLRNIARRTPAFVASRKYPLLMRVAGVAVRAWPAFVPRGRGAKTFFHPKLLHRVATVKDEIYWMFEATNRKPSAFGTKTAEQTLDDVVDHAKIWIRSEPT